MRPLEKLHDRYVFDRRVAVLAGCLADLLPGRARLLDVGCGDGLISREIIDRRPDVEIRGIDVLVRKACAIPSDKYDGREIPHAAGSFDGVMLIDVLHHARDPLALLSEAARVARDWLLIKDHLQEGVLAGPVLRLMDMVGNRRFGVSLPYNYWSRERWQQAFDRLGLSIGAWRGGLGLYPFPANLLFERGLHFIARLEKGMSSGAAPR